MAEDREERRDEAFAAALADRDRTLAALRELERASAMAVAGPGWLDAVAGRLAELEEAVVDEHSDVGRPDSLLSMIATEDPRRFASRVRQIHAHQDGLIRDLATLRLALDTGSPGPDDVRNGVARIVAGIHETRAMQTDLVYEAIERDLGRR